MLYHTCIYNRLPKDELSGSKHVEDFIKTKCSFKKIHFWFMLCNYITMHGEKYIKNTNSPFDSAKPQVV